MYLNWRMSEDPFESVNNIVKTKCIGCNEDIDCRRFVCKDCYDNIIEMNKK